MQGFYYGLWGGVNLNYHGIETDSMLNGDGLRVVLWVSGCLHHCFNCQNPQTWNKNSGIPFDNSAEKELFKALNKSYIAGITFSGGDPLYSNNIEEVTRLAKKFKEVFSNKTIWLYTGYLYEEIKDLEVMQYIDVLVDGEFIEILKDNTLHWKGSSNQRVIDVKKTRRLNQMVLHSV